MDLSLLIFTLEIYKFCMKCIEFTTRTYNFKNLAVGSLIWGAKTGVNSSYFPQKISTCPVICCILTLSRLGLLGAPVNKNKYIFQLTSSRIFLKLYVGCMRKCRVTMKIAAPEIGFQLVLQPIARRVDQALAPGLFAKTKVFMADYSFLRIQ